MTEPSNDPRPRLVVSWVVAGVVVVVVLLAISGRLPVGPRHPGAGSNVQTVPSPGQTVAAFLKDGTPVWVVRHPEGGVTVLEAFDAHVAFGLRTLVGWCARSGWFEDPVYGSKYDSYGDWELGPAPRGLTRRGFQLVDGAAKIRIGAALSPQPRGAHDPRARGPVGTLCDGAGPRGRISMPPLSSSDRTPLEASLRSEGRWVPFQGTLLWPARGRIVMCDGVDAAKAPALLAGRQPLALACRHPVPVIGLDNPSNGAIVAFGTWLGRAVEGRFVDLARVAVLPCPSEPSCPNGTPLPAGVGLASIPAAGG